MLYSTDKSKQLSIVVPILYSSMILLCQTFDQVLPSWRFPSFTITYVSVDRGVAGGH